MTKCLTNNFIAFITCNVYVRQVHFTGWNENWRFFSQQNIQWNSFSPVQWASFWWTYSRAQSAAALAYSGEPVWLITHRRSKAYQDFPRVNMNCSFACCAVIINYYHHHHYYNYYYYQDIIIIITVTQTLVKSLMFLDPNTKNIWPLKTDMNTQRARFQLNKDPEIPTAVLLSQRCLPNRELTGFLDDMGSQAGFLSYTRV